MKSYMHDDLRTFSPLLVILLRTPRIEAIHAYRCCTGRHENRGARIRCQELFLVLSLTVYRCLHIGSRLLCKLDDIVAIRICVWPETVLEVLLLITTIGSDGSAL